MGAGRDLAQPLARVYRQIGPPPRRDARQLGQAYRSASGRLFDQCSSPAVFFCLQYTRALELGLGCRIFERPIFKNRFAFFDPGPGNASRQGFFCARRILRTCLGAAPRNANALADELIKASDEGVFFCALNFYSYVAKRP
jgi:hypothetical protein